MPAYVCAWVWSDDAASAGTRLTPRVVPVLKILEAIQIVGQYAAVARRKPLVAGGLTNRIDDIVQLAVIPPAVIQIPLHVR